MAGPTSAPPATGVYQASAPPAGYPTSAPPATGIYQASAPPASTLRRRRPPSSGPPATGIYQAAPPPGDRRVPGLGAQCRARRPALQRPRHHAGRARRRRRDRWAGIGRTDAAGRPQEQARTGPRAVVVVAVFLLAVAGTGIVVALNNAGSTSFAVNSCVKQDGDSARRPAARTRTRSPIVQKVEKPESCSDASQPYVVLQHKGQKDEVLCLRPAAQK